ncbi:NET1-associated nuclear protein 1 (U3 small nucleolar RNA-associated protein 17) [Trypanosoma conorhini]|uniref:NET1-associated nuclear protein 1 (U3 small nucleolar RNA-associated protein 17) n=1 Tax=Trypanosoma conorhini TaxID=83891 RepID=A0A422QA56_9TRYP|nr:NET1-associated nuclear protein 1 (U3 small nucleolar RNA-associated protein 17) [Trypanosoma conorhini]RNF26850.1 NET1-associated nuclear protein 1 (U3 small nucleolar RNA-associated protein 17) [Trypanosoma conorhini]
MALPHLLAACKDAVCVAEDYGVAFYAPKNLKKFRVESLSGARVVGLCVSASAGGEMQLHVVDAEANWFLISLAHVEVLASSSIKWGEDSSPEPGNRPVVSSRRAALDRSRVQREGGILEAHFHEARGELHCVFLAATGVYEASLRDTSLIRAEQIISFPIALRDCTMAAGRSTGLVLVGQRGERWAQYSMHGNRDAHSPRQLALPVGIQSLTCNPVRNSVAVGGTRGELVVFPSVTESHYFSDHWHHTPLTALSFSVDGNSLFSGARESVMLVWNMSSYAYKKVGCSLGPIRCILPSASASCGSQLVLACAESTLATLDLLQMRVEGFIEGVQWSAAEACSGLVVGRWMGQPAVILTGLPNVLRVCDPFTQQSLYSLHISSQMETIPIPPRHGIQHVGLLNDNRTIVTYEEFAGTSLPPLLRFWAYDTHTKQHVETQVIYSPHSSRVIALQTDEVRGRVFTLCANAMKCWGEVTENVNDAYATGQKGWANKSTSATPSHLVQDMILATDGSLCFVSDDSVHVYGVANVYPGQPWHRLLTLTQLVSLAPLQELQLLSDNRVVAARDETRVYFWSLVVPHRPAVIWKANHASVRAMCSCSATSVLVATSDGGFSELCGAAQQMGEELGRHASATIPHRITFMRCLPGAGKERVAVVDEVSGFRVLHVALAATNAQEVKEGQAEEDGVWVQKFEGTSGQAPRVGGDEKQLGHFFHDVAHTNKPSEVGREESSLGAARRATEAKKWLGDVLADSAYTAPPMSSVLSSYLKKRSGIPTL